MTAGAALFSRPSSVEASEQPVAADGARAPPLNRSGRLNKDGLDDEHLPESREQGWVTAGGTREDAQDLRGNRLVR